jgi:membrane protein YdbS with pleckstrin-like domain
MALIKCPECGGTVSSRAPTCPSCGFPIAESVAQPAEPSSSTPAAASSAEPLLEVRQSWWHFFWYLVFAWLLIPWLIAWLKRKQVVMRVYADRVSLERGLLSKCYREFFISDIRSIDIDQGMLGKLVGIGNLTFSTAANLDAVERIDGIPNPQQVRDFVIARRKGA